MAGGGELARQLLPALGDHVSGRIGSPIVAGSTMRLKSPSSVLSVAVTLRSKVRSEAIIGCASAIGDP
jgi:hypothetical protein